MHCDIRRRTYEAIQACCSFLVANHPVITFYHVEVVVLRMGDEFPGCIRQRY